MSDHLNQQIGSGKAENQNDGDDGWCAWRYPATMDTLGARLKHAREAAGLTQAELAERVGMAGQSSIEAIEAGRSKRPTRIHEIAKACNVTVEWLQGRPEGGPLKQSRNFFRSKKAESFDDNSDTFKIDRNFFQNTVRERARTTPLTEEFEQQLTDQILGNPPFSIQEIDIRAGAAYGGGKSDEEWQDGDRAVDKPLGVWTFPSGFAQRELGLKSELADIVQVRGDSMEDGSARGLTSGDRVIIDRRDTDPRQGGIFAVYDGEGVIIKQVELLRGHEPPRIICKSLNHRYDPVELILDGSVRIIGRVAGVISRR